MIKSLTKNWQAKLMCLVAAAGLWVYVAASQNAVDNFPGSINIKTLNQPSGLIAVYDHKTINIKISADPTIWRTLSADSFSAYVDLSGLSEGIHELPVEVTTSVSGVQIVQKDPEKIMVSLEPTIQKEVKVNARIEGSAAPGMVAGNITLNPDTVEVKGPKSIVSNLNEVVAAIQLNGESQSFQKNIAIMAVDEKGETVSGLEISPSEVSASISVVESSNNKTVGVKVKTSGTPKDGYYVSQITTDPATIDITGTSTVLSTISNVETFVVNINNLSSDINSTVALNINNGITLLSGQPTKVKVNVQILPSEIQKTIAPSVNYLNLGNIYAVTNLDPSVIKVTVSGRGDIIKGLIASDVQLLLDFKNSSLTKDNESVTFNIQPNNFKLPAGVSVLSYTPTSLTVSLQKQQ